MSTSRLLRAAAATLLGIAAAMAGIVGITVSSTAALASPVPTGFAVRGLSALSGSSWWVFGTIPGCVHGCEALARTTTGGASFSLTSRQPSATGIPAGTTTLRMADAVHGWLLAPGGAVGHQVFRTFDGGVTWAPLALAHRVTALDVGAGRVWLTTVDGSVLGTWTSAALGTVVFARPLTATISAAPGTPGLVAQSDGGAVVLAAQVGFVHLRQWHVTHSASAVVGSPYWCFVDLGLGQLSASSGTTWVSCPQGTTDFYGYSTGAGAGVWHAGPAVTSSASRIAVGGLDATRAVVGVQGVGALFRVTTAGAHTSTVAPPLGGANRFFSFIGFTNSLDGFAIGESGALLHTTDSGQHWSLVTI